MMTANDIRNVKFNRSLGGYKTDEVDTFLDNCADTVEELTKASAENERKMQVLAETVVEYRNQEDTIRTALISAQRMSETIIQEAQAKADAIVQEAESKAKNIHEEAEKEIVDEREELRRIKAEVSAFKNKLMSVYREHLTLIGVLEDETLDEQDTAVPQSATEESNETEEDTLDEAPHTIETKLDISAFRLEDDEEN